MIPILFESNETEFNNNGLGRLRDCISCVVTEERNGIYECDFEYPVTAEDFKDIRIGRIIGVTHDESDDIQPFDIVSYERPIDGIVTFHCTHISYRQSYLTVTGKNINSPADAFTRLADYATPTNPFSYQTDKTSTGYVGAFDGIPKTVRSMLGGVEGSILDAYGGEYEWDRFNVILHSARGVDRDFSIRYGVNMTDYNEELDSSGTYMACVPYWTDGTTTVVGDKQTANGTTITNRGECVPLDVSDKFEDKPTKAQVNSMGLSMMQSSDPMIPSQNISVEFVRLQDVGYEGYGNLLQCRLCDTVNVIFPYYDTQARFKIVKTVWDVLADRYESMELGDLSVTLSEALGIGSESNRASELTDFVVEQSTSGNWKYRKWNSGKIEAWYSETVSTQYSFTTRGSSSAYYYTNSTWVSHAISLPANLFTAVENAFANVTSSGYLIISVAGQTASTVTLRLCTPYSASPTIGVVSLYVVGT